MNRLDNNVVLKEFSTFIDQLPNPADIITDRKEAISVYSEMLLDEKIGSSWELRKNKTLDFPFFIKKVENEKVNKAVELIPTSIWNKFLKSAIDAEVYGHRPIDITYTQKNGYWIPSQIGKAKIDRFSYDNQGNLYIRTNLIKSPCNQKYRWLIHRNDGSKRDEPYGNSILNKVFWLWSFKKLGLEFWLKMEKRFAVPSFLALFETDENNEKILNSIVEGVTSQIQNITSGSSGAMANIKEVKQVKADGAVKDFRLLCDYCNEGIAVGLTSQVLASGTTDNGNRALGEVHSQTLLSLIKNDARDLKETASKLLVYFMQINFPEEAEYPEFEIDTDNKASFEQVMQAIEKGIPVSKEALYNEYKLPKPTGDEDIFEKKDDQMMMFSDEKKQKTAKKKRKMVITNTNYKR